MILGGMGPVDYMRRLLTVCYEKCEQLPTRDKSALL